MKVKNVINVLLCGCFVLAFAVWCFFGPKQTYSESERRTLAKFPEVSWEAISSGKFAKGFEEYATDAFPMRDFWRSVKAYTRLGAFAQKDNNKLFLSDGHIGKLEYPMSQPMMDHAAELFTKVWRENFPDAKVYFAMIPDKNKEIADLKMDYDAFEKEMSAKLSFAENISISDLLTAEDYYFTDHHWRQEKIIDVAKRLAEQMGTKLPEKYMGKELDVKFYGTYAGQSAMNPDPDQMMVVYNEVISQLKAEGLNDYTGQFVPLPIYNQNKSEGKDPYELYLSGNQSLVKITNPANTSGKRLIVFRDSFGSAIAPLLAQGYSETILVDLRYIPSVAVHQYVDFRNADVLFLYSTMLLNNSLGMQ